MMPAFYAVPEKHCHRHARMYIKNNAKKRGLWAGNNHNHDEGAS